MLLRTRHPSGMSVTLHQAVAAAVIHVIRSAQLLLTRTVTVLLMLKTTASITAIFSSLMRIMTGLGMCVILCQVAVGVLDHRVSRNV